MGRINKEWFVDRVKNLTIGMDNIEITMDEEVNIYGRMQQVDVVIRNKNRKDYDDLHNADYYCFKKSDNDFKYRINYINNFTQYDAALFKIVDDMLYTIDFGMFSKKKILTEYAEEFYRFLIKEEQLLYIPDCDEGLLPLLFYDKSNYDNEEGTQTSGCLHSNSEKQRVIKIYNLRYTDIDALKLIIRHELIHYFLACANLKYGDDCAIFHILCKKYDAREYMPMTEEEEKLYYKFLGTQEISEDSFKSILRVVGLKKEAITPKEETFLNSLEKLGEQTKLIVENKI